MILENIFLAKVSIKRETVMIGVHKKTRKGYKCYDTIPAVKVPLEEIKYDRFQRWCTSFDT